MKIEIKRRFYQSLSVFARIGYRIFATKGTADFLKNNGLHVDLVTKVHENENADDNILNELREGRIDLVINTMGHDIEKNSDGFIIRQWLFNRMFHY